MGIKGITKQFCVMLACLLASYTSFAQKKSSNIAMIMPFCSRQIIANPNCYDAQLGNLCREYYQGALIALDSFERGRVSVSLSVFDTENDSMTLIRLLQRQGVKNADLIIGPVLQGGNKVMSTFVKEKQISHVSPLMTFSKTKLEDPWWISANPDLAVYANNLYSHITTVTHDSANILVISDKSSFDNNITGVLKQITPVSRNVKFKFIEYKKGMDLVPFLSLTISNHIVVPSANEAVVTNVFKSIKDTDDTFLMTSYGFPHWLEFKNPDFDVWQRMRVTILSPFYVDYESEPVKTFITAYRERFYTEPTDAAFKGYDQMMLFGHELSKNGKSFVSQMEGKSFPSLGTVYRFKRQKEGESYQNDYLNLIRLEDFKMRKVN